MESPSHLEWIRGHFKSISTLAGISWKVLFARSSPPPTLPLLETPLGATVSRVGLQELSFRHHSIFLRFAGAHVVIIVGPGATRDDLHMLCVLTYF